MTHSLEQHQTFLLLALVLNFSLADSRLKENPFDNRACSGKAQFSHMKLIIFLLCLKPWHLPLGKHHGGCVLVFNLPAG
jgi:hypothetical protein